MERARRGASRHLGGSDTCFQTAPGSLEEEARLGAGPGVEGPPTPCGPKEARVYFKSNGGASGLGQRNGIIVFACLKVFFSYGIDN